MTDYAATVAGHAALLQVAMQRVGTSSESVERYETELRHRERELEDVLNARWIEIKVEVERTSALIGQVATLEGQLRDSESAADVVRLYAKRLEAEVKRLKKLVPKEAK
jgi:hypothetical protein